MFNKFRKISSLHLLSLSVSTLAIIYLLQIIANFLRIFSDVFLVLILAWLISFVIEPLVDLFTGKGLTRIKSAALIYSIVAIVVIYLLLKATPIMVSEINSLSVSFPKYLYYFPGWANRIGDFLLSTLNNSVAIVQQIASGLFYLVFILLLSFYFVVDKEKIKNGLLLFVPKQFRDEVEYLNEAINTSFAGFIRAQVVFGIVFGFFNLIFLLIFAPQYAILASFLSGILNMLPLIGPFLGLIPPILVLIPLGFNQAFWLVLIIFLFQQILFNLLGPKIYGQNVKLHPIWVLLAFLIGFKIAGAWGSIFAVPVASVLGIVFSTVTKRLVNRIDRE